MFGKMCQWAALRMSQELPEVVVSDAQPRGGSSLWLPP